MNHVGSLTKQKQEKNLKYKPQMIKTEVSSIPRKVLLRKPCNNTSGRESKTGARTEGSDVSTWGCTLHRQSRQSHCRATAVLQTPSLFPPIPKPLILLTIQF